MTALPLEVFFYSRRKYHPKNRNKKQAIDKRIRSTGIAMKKYRERQLDFSNRSSACTWTAWSSNEIQK